MKIRFSINGEWTTPYCDAGNLLRDLVDDPDFLEAILENDNNRRGLLSFLLASDSGLYREIGETIQAIEREFPKQWSFGELANIHATELLTAATDMEIRCIMETFLAAFSGDAASSRSLMVAFSGARAAHGAEQLRLGQSRKSSDYWKEKLISALLAESEAQQTLKAKAPFLRELADLGSAKGQCLYALLLKCAHAGDSELGGVFSEDEASPQQIVHWLKNSAEQGFSEALFNLGKCEEEGFADPPDYRNAFRHYLAAAEKGLPEALFKVGKWLAEGTHVAFNFDEAVKWMRMAADAGDNQAKEWLKDKQTIEELKKGMAFPTYDDFGEEAFYNSAEDISSIMDAHLGAL